MIKRTYPDFLEKPRCTVRVSEGILGKLYRDLNMDDRIKSFIENQFKN